MTAKAVLLDLENNMPPAQLFRDIVEHYPVLYLFNCQGKFEYSLEDLTEFSSWISSGQIVILDIPETAQKEFEYAVVVGQLMALLEDGTHVDVISAMSSSQMLLDMMQGSNIRCSLIQIQPEQDTAFERPKYKIPSLEKIKATPYLQMVKKYCDAMAKAAGKPNTLASLKNSVANILQLLPDHAQQVVGMLINLKIVKRDDDQVNFRKKVLKQWAQLNLEHDAAPAAHNIQDALTLLDLPQPSSEHTAVSAHNPQQGLYANFQKIDPVQLEVIKKLHELKQEKPKDIYELRDLLEQLFPKSDIRLLLKELIDKGYIYWNGHEVLYSHEMFLN
ncbi:hypothetical protein [Acinetobacter pragensis]|uniref:PIN-like domain-containing protein n=1 Tax=Acinetobacter pragensis TaxID=1806892 RepID=A0A151Y4M2_9GAMM|nr:hypothetical protein [Acinetobacter pragensis]KYQ72978.1 hypothetical protein AZH43_01375 [Acinetobacter pragensis]